jgi:hypothetical protein
MGCLWVPEEMPISSIANILSSRLPRWHGAVDDIHIEANTCQFCLTGQALASFPCDTIPGIRAMEMPFELFENHELSRIVTHLTQPMREISNTATTSVWSTVHISLSATALTMRFFRGYVSQIWSSRHLKLYTNKFFPRTSCSDLEAPFSVFHVTATTS